MAQDELTTGKLLRSSDVLLAWAVAAGAASLAALLLVLLGSP